MSRVFLLEPTKHSVQTAECYGEVIVVFPESLTRPSIWEHEQYLLALQNKLTELNYDPQNDFFLAAGSSVPLLIAMNYLTQVYDSFRVLFWHAVAQEYVIRVFSALSYIED